MELKTLNILDLNDDCLGAVFSYLNKKEQVLCGLTCKRFGDIFRSYCKSDHSYFKATIDWCRDPFFIKYFKLAGSLIKRLDIESGADLNEDLIILFCPNLEQIGYSNLCLYRSFIGKLKKLAKNLSSLHSLKLERCSFGDYIIEGLSEIPSIDELAVMDNGLLTGRYLNRFPNMKLLTLENCMGIKSKYMRELSMRALQELNIKECLNVSVESLQNLTKACQSLDKLSFTCHEVNDPELYRNLFMQLQDLKKLNINRCNDRFLSVLAQNLPHNLENLTLEYEYVKRGRYFFGYQYNYRNILTKSQNLKEFSVDGYHYLINSFTPMPNLEKLYLSDCSIASGGIFNILQHCPKLVFLNIENNRADVRPILLTKAFQLLSNGGKPKRSLKLRLKITGLPVDYFQSFGYNVHKHFLELEQLEEDVNPAPVLSSDDYNDDYNGPNLLDIFGYNF